MTARINPTKARFFPEELPEAISVTASTGGTSIASYSSFSPFVMILKQLWTPRPMPGITFRMDNDSGHGVIDSSTVESRPAQLPVDIELIAQDSMDMWSIGIAVPTYFAYVTRVTKPTIFEKIKYSMSMEDYEVKLADEFDIKRKYAAGLLGGRTDQTQFKKVYEVARKVTVTAGSNTRVGRLINVKKGEKAVILGISVDRELVHSAFGGPGANDTYITINRDVVDSSHVKLDCCAMPPIEQEMKCYIPAIDRHEILIESTTGITNLPVRIRYGVAPLTLLEKIRWKLPTTAEEDKIGEEFDLFDSVRAGVL